MNLLLGISIIVVADALAIGALLFVRRGAPEGSYFSDGDRASGVFGVLATGFAIFAGFVIFLAFTTYDDTRSGAEAEAQQRAITTLLRFFLPQIPLYGLYFLGSAFLNVRKKFVLPMWTPIVNNLVLKAGMRYHLPAGGGTLQITHQSGGTIYYGGPTVSSTSPPSSSTCEHCDALCRNLERLSCPLDFAPHFAPVAHPASRRRPSTEGASPVPGANSVNRAAWLQRR